MTISILSLVLFLAGCLLIKFLQVSSKIAILDYYRNSIDRTGWSPDLESRFQRLYTKLLLSIYQPGSEGLPSLNPFEQFVKEHQKVLHAQALARKDLQAVYQNFVYSNKFWSVRLYGKGCAQRLKLVRSEFQKTYDQLAELIERAPHLLLKHELSNVVHIARYGISRDSSLIEIENNLRRIRPPVYALHKRYIK